MTHPLEHNTTERAHFAALTDTTARAAWRRVTEALTGSLPTWATRRKNGMSASFDVAEAVARYRAGGIALRALAADYGVTAQAIGHHVRKAAATEASTSVVEVAR